jgi:hypothetical protein
MLYQSHFNIFFPFHVILFQRIAQTEFKSFLLGFYLLALIHLIFYSLQNSIGRSEQHWSVKAAWKQQANRAIFLPQASWTGYLRSLFKD